jgi:putative DNA primase/helicase
VREAVAAGTTVYLVEGEQDVHAMESLDVVATTAPMGPRNFHKVDASPLYGAKITVIPDGDEAGQKWAQQVLNALDVKVDSLRFMAPKIGKDAADHVAAGYGLGDFVPIEPPAEPNEQAGPDVLPGPGNPMGVARVIIGDHLTDDGELTLRHWRGGWMQWRETHWVEAEEKAIKSWAYGRLERAWYWDTRAEELRPWNPNRRKVGDVLDALAAVAHTAEAIDTPSWLDSVRNGPQDQSSYRATEIVACSNGLLHVGTRKLLELTPLFYNRVAVPFAYDAAAPEPTRWLAFLDQLWPDDPESIAALQEFFGYVLSGRTDLHKIVLLIGPTRSGKGTIARVLSALLGKGNVAGPTLASLGTNFGLSPLLGKPLAVVSDARLAGGNVHQVVERLLSISGEDLLTVDRKFKEPWSGKLPSRFLILSNELPRFGDASGAIANRFVVLAMHESFLDKENRTLTEELTTELTGILSWSLDGLDRLSRQGKFTEPRSSVDSILALQDLVSPTAAFVRDRCEVGIGHAISVAEVFDAWKAWAEDNGHKPGTVQTFGRDIRAVVPTLRQARPRDGGDRERRYVGIRLKSTTHSGGDRGPVRTTDQSSAHKSPNSAPVRDGPQPNQLQLEKSGQRTCAGRWEACANSNCLAFRACVQAEGDAAEE